MNKSTNVGDLEGKTRRLQFSLFFSCKFSCWFESQGMRMKAEYIVNPLC